MGGAVFMREVVLPLLPRPHVARISGRKRSHVARILRPTRAVREQRVLGRQYLERKTPQSGAYCVPNPRIWEDNPRWEGRYLGGRWRFPLLPRPNVVRIPSRTRSELFPSVRTPPCGAYCTLVKLVKLVNFLNNIVLRSQVVHTPRGSAVPPQ